MVKLIQSRPVRHSFVIIRGQSEEYKFETNTANGIFDLSDQNIEGNLRYEQDFVTGISLPESSFTTLGNMLTMKLDGNVTNLFPEGQYWLTITAIKNNDLNEKSVIFSGNVELKNA